MYALKTRTRVKCDRCPRYSLTCPRTLYYPLYAVAQKHPGALADKTDLQDNPQAFIIIENLMMEVTTF